MNSPNSRNSEPTPIAPELTGAWCPRQPSSAGSVADIHRSLVPLPPGETPVVPGYELLRILGRGGMGVVYQARQIKLNRLVALKMILRDGDRADPKDLIRFLVEAEAAAAVRHPHVVQVYEYGDADGRPFLALEYLPGGSLADHLKFRGRMEPRAAAELVHKLAVGIQAVHDRGIVHRDLKPANVLFDEEGGPKVSDFGLAKRDDHNDLTAREAVMGTPAYMSPEQADGGTKFVGPAADIYSLGVILYVCLTSKLPFEDSDPVNLLRKVIDMEPDRPQKHVPTLPQDIELICLKCLAKLPHERYSTATALAKDLAHFTAGEPVSVRPAGLLERGMKWARRKPVLAAAYGLTVVSLVMIALAAGAVWLWQRAEGARGQAEQAQIVAESARDGEASARKRADEQTVFAVTNAKRADTERGRAERIKYALDLNAAMQAWQGGQFPRMESILRSYLPETNLTDLRSFEWHYLWRMLHQARPRLSITPNSFLSIRLNPDGQHCTAVSGLWGRELWDLTSGRLVVSNMGILTKTQLDTEFRRPVAMRHPDALFPLPHDDIFRVETSAYSEDSKQFFFIDKGNGQLSALKLGEGPPIKVWQQKIHVGAFNRISVSPCGKWVAVSGGNLTLYDAVNGKELWTLPTTDIRAPGSGPVSFSSDGNELLVVNGFSRSITGFESKTGLKRRQIDTGRMLLSGVLACSPDGRRIAAITIGGQVLIWDFETGRFERSIRSPRPTLSIAYRPMTPYELVTADEDNVLRVWNPTTDVPTIEFRGHRSQVKQMAFHSRSPHNLVSLSADGQVFVWDMDVNAQMTHYPGAGHSAEYAVFPHASDRLIGVGFEGGTVDINFQPTHQNILAWEWKYTTREVYVKQIGKPVFNPFMAGSRDGKRFAIGSAGEPLRVVNAETHAEIGVFEKLPPKLAASWGQYKGGRAILNGDGTRLAQVHSGSTGEELLIWDVDRHVVLRRLSNHHPRAFSADGSRLVVSQGPSKSIHSVLNLNTGGQSPGINLPTSFVAISPDSRQVAIGSEADTFSIWDVDSGVRRLQLNGPIGRIDKAAFTPDGMTLASFGEDGLLRFWDLQNGQQTMSIRVTDPVRAGTIYKPEGEISFSPDGLLLVLRHGVNYVIDARPPETPVVQTPSWMIRDGKRSLIPKLNESSLMDRLPAFIDQLQEAAKKQEPREKEFVTIGAHTGPVLGLSFSPNGKQLVTGDTLLARVWDPATGKELKTLTTPAPIIRTWFNASNQILTVCSVEAANRLHTSEGKPLDNLIPRDGGTPRESLFSPDGKRVVSTHTTGILTVFDVVDRKRITSFTAFDPKQVQNGLAISPDGKRVCSAVGKGDDWKLKVWDLETEKEVQSWTASDKPVWGVAWSTDGKWIATCGVDQTANVWNAETGKLNRTLTGAAKTVSRVAFGRDGKLLAGSCLDGIVRVWDLTTGQIVKTFDLEMTGNGNVAFSPDGKRLATSAPGVVRIWELP